MSVRRMRRSARSSEAIRDAITSLSHPTSLVDVSSTGCVRGETASFSLIMGMVPSWRSSEAVSRTWGDENVEAGGDIQAKREPWRSAAHTHAEPRCPALGLSSIARANAQYTKHAAEHCSCGCLSLHLLECLCVLEILLRDKHLRAAKVVL